MRDLPLWAQLATALVAIVFVISFLRSLAAYIIDVVTIHALRCDVAAIKIRQFKQLRGLQEGLHPGDIFGEEHVLDEALLATIAAQGTAEPAPGSQNSAPGSPEKPAQPSATPRGPSGTPTATQPTAPSTTPAEPDRLAA